MKTINLRKIAAAEGVSVKCVSVSIRRGLESMKKYLKNFPDRGKKQFQSPVDY